MKKIAFIFISLLLLLGFGIFSTLKKGETKTEIKESWTLSSQAIKNIEFYGSKQPIEVHIKRGTVDKTTVAVEGNVSEEAAQFLSKKVKVTKDSLYIPFSNHGFTLALSSEGKDKLQVDITLGRDTSFDKVFIDTLVGDVFVTVPQDFDGTYTLHTNQTGEIVTVPDTQETMKSIVEVDGYSKIYVKKGESNG